MRPFRSFYLCGAIIATYGFTGLQGCSAAPAESPLPSKAPVTGRALWVWDATVLTNTAKAIDLLEFSSQHNFGVLYLSTGDIFNAGQREADDPKHVTAAHLGAFLQAAHAKHIEVEGLDGDPSFSLTEKHALALTRFQKALSYNAAAPIGQRLDGWQWDTEPYVLPAFKADPQQQKQILGQYLDSVDEMVSALKASPSLRLGYAIPSFFDNADRAVNWHGQTKPPAFHLMDKLNELDAQGAAGYVAIMAYRDKTDGPNGTIAISTGEMDYAAASAPHVKVWVGQETADVKGDPPSITFWQEGAPAVESAALKITDAFKANPTYGGIAIHHYASYKALIAKPELTDGVTK